MKPIENAQFVVTLDLTTGDDFVINGLQHIDANTAYNIIIDNLPAEYALSDISRTTITKRLAELTDTQCLFFKDHLLFFSEEFDNGSFTSAIMPDDRAFYTSPTQYCVVGGDFAIDTRKVFANKGDENFYDELSELILTAESMPDPDPDTEDFVRELKDCAFCLKVLEPYKYMFKFEIEDANTGIILYRTNREERLQEWKDKHNHLKDDIYVHCYSE